MIIRGFLVLSIFMKLGLIANIESRESHELTISECAAKGGECDESRGRPVCGTDDQTYPTRCHLLRVQCSGHQVSLKYRGPCKACKEARDYAVKHKTRSPPKFIPRCKPDGTYAPIQCLGDTGCWCSDISGRPIENTSVRLGKPNCREHNKANIRRSPPRNSSPSRNGQQRTCNQVDRATFNANLIKVFQSEYIRSRQHQHNNAGEIGGGGSSSIGVFIPPPDNLVLDWKFAHLDANVNDMLDKNEFRELKKLVKRAVKPRRCGRAFGKFCDVDNDDRLSRDEWNSCISKDGINRHAANDHKFSAAHNDPLNGYINHHNSKISNNNNNRHIMISNHHQIHSNNNHNNIYSSSNNNNNNNDYNKNIFRGTLDHLESESEGEDDKTSQLIDYDEELDYDTEETYDDDNLSANKPSSSLDSSTNSSKFQTLLWMRPKADSPLKESEGESDCLADQATALEEQRHDGNIYVPECTPDGRYQRVQCYRSTPYCWCVHEDSGKNIPGTSVKDKRPQCDSIFSVSRPMKGCPEPRKAVFLKDLKEFLKSEIITKSNSGANTTKWSSEDERIATLSFVLLDKNKNKSWERKEWKAFRELVINSKTFGTKIRKCGKKMPRYCDVNSDKKITLSEWLNCLQAQRTEVEAIHQKHTTLTNESINSKSLKLNGTNPLDEYLKD